jgi:hypothetical protein
MAMVMVMVIMMVMMMVMATMPAAAPCPAAHSPVIPHLYDLLHGLAVCRQRLVLHQHVPLELARQLILDQLSASDALHNVSPAIRLLVPHSAYLECSNLARGVVPQVLKVHVAERVAHVARHGPQQAVLVLHILNL